MTQSFRYLDQEILYTLQRTCRRRSVALVIKSDTELVVRLPQSLPLYKIHGILQNRAPWILEKQNKIRTLKQSHPPKRLVSGEAIPYLGENLRLELVKARGKRAHCGQHGPCLVLSIAADTTEAQMQRLIVNWYRQQSLPYLTARAEFYRSAMGAFPAKIAIRDQKTKWGSCSPQGHVNFNWRLMMMPREVSDYVVVHEMSHLLFLNHGKKFWRKVEAVLPDFSERRRWLQAHSFEYMNYFS